MKPNKNMLIIGITGEAGAGKSVVLNYLKENYPCEVLVADIIGNEVKEPGGICYQPVIDLLGEDILLPDKTMNRTLIAERIFKDEKLVDKMNEIIHPAVHDEIFRRIDVYSKDDKIKFVFIEAALLIEAGYVDDLDELWYICATSENRRKRLKETRGYTDARIDGIMKNQLTAEEFCKYADRVIENTGTKEELYHKIDCIMGEYKWQHL